MLARILPLILAALVVGCGSSERAEESRVVGDALTVYSSLPHSGPLAPVSRDIVRAEKLALEEAGGRAGEFRISFVSLDSADPQTGHWTPKQVAENARTAVEDLQTIAYLGELEAGASTVSVPILNEGGMLQVSPGDTFAGLTEQGGPGEPERYYPSGRRTFARLVPTDAAQAAQLVALMRRRGVRRVSLADDRQVAGTALINRVAGLLRDRGIEVVDRERLDPRDDVPDDLGEDVLDDRADAFLFGGARQPFATEVLRAVHAAAPRVDLFAPDGVALVPDLPDRAGDAAERLLLTAIVPDEGAGGGGFAMRFRARYGSDPHPRAVLGYAAMRLVLEAVERAGADAASRPAVIGQALRIAGEAPAAFAPFRISDGGLVRVASEL